MCVGWTEFVWWDSLTVCVCVVFLQEWVGATGARIAAVQHQRAIQRVCQVLLSSPLSGWCPWPHHPLTSTQQGQSSQTGGGKWWMLSTLLFLPESVYSSRCSSREWSAFSGCPWVYQQLRVTIVLLQLYLVSLYYGIGHEFRFLWNIPERVIHLLGTLVKLEQLK